MPRATTEKKKYITNDCKKNDNLFEAYILEASIFFQSKCTSKTNDLGYSCCPRIKVHTLYILLINDLQHSMILIHSFRFPQVKLRRYG